MSTPQIPKQECFETRMPTSNPIYLVRAVVHDAALDRAAYSTDFVPVSSPWNSGHRPVKAYSDWRKLPTPLGAFLQVAIRRYDAPNANSLSIAQYDYAKSGLFLHLDDSLMVLPRTLRHLLIQNTPEWIDNFSPPKKISDWAADFYESHRRLIKG